MLEIKFIRENAELIKENCLNRGADVDLEALLKLDDDRRDLMQKIDSLREERNKASKTRPTDEEISKIKESGIVLAKLEDDLSKIEPKYIELLFAVPNLTHPKVKISKLEDDVEVVSAGNKPKKFDFAPLDHVQIAESLDLIDFERGTKVTGAKFYFLKNELALLELALSLYAMELSLIHI